MRGADPMDELIQAFKDVELELRDHMIVTLAGHVDHGKTTLVRASMGVDTDRLAEEKARGLTIDLGSPTPNTWAA